MGKKRSNNFQISLNYFSLNDKERNLFFWQKRCEWGLNVPVENNRFWQSCAITVFPLQQEGPNLTHQMKCLRKSITFITRTHLENSQKKTRRKGTWKGIGLTSCRSQSRPIRLEHWAPYWCHTRHLMLARCSTPWCSTKLSEKALSVILCSSFNVEMSSSCDKSANIPEATL